MARLWKHLSRIVLSRFVLWIGHANEEEKEKSDDELEKIPFIMKQEKQTSQHQECCNSSVTYVQEKNTIFEPLENQRLYE
jgi:hypothetical protein